MSYSYDGDDWDSPVDIRSRQVFSSAVTTKGRETVKTVEQLKQERADAIAEAERLDRIIAQRDKLGSDPFKNGNILKVEMRYPPSRTTYTYAVIKIAGRFWLSGKMQSSTPVTSLSDEVEGKKIGWTWENFVAWLAQGDASVWQATYLEQVL